MRTVALRSADGGLGYGAPACVFSVRFLSRFLRPPLPCLIVFNILNILAGHPGKPRPSDGGPVNTRTESSLRVETTRGDCSRTSRAT